MEDIGNLGDAFLPLNYVSPWDRAPVTRLQSKPSAPSGVPQTQVSVVLEGQGAAAGEQHREKLCLKRRLGSPTEFVKNAPGVMV